MMAAIAGANHSRRGTILILVAGLAAILLSVATALLVSLRSGSSEADLLMRDAQSRIMLSAAIAYIQETSRIGWGGESFGWNDVRTTSGSTFGGRTVDENGVPGPLLASQTSLVATGYPRPGTFARGDAFCWERPPGAISERFVPNPIEFRPELRSGDDTNKLLRSPTYVLSSGTFDADFAAPLVENYKQLIAANFEPSVLGGYNGADKVNVPPGTTSRQGKFGSLDQQPLADDWGDFVNGIKNPRPESLGRAWFRVYRETLADHDGNGSTPWYNSVPLPGYGVFVVTVGAGPTRGYRFWNANGKDYLNGNRSRSFSTGADVDFAESSGLFQNEESFIAQRVSERISWYRLEWSASVAGYDAWGENAPLSDSAWSFKDTRTIFVHRTNNGNNPGYYPNFGGSIRWLMRLEKEPEKW